MSSKPKSKSKSKLPFIIAMVVVASGISLVLWNSGILLDEDVQVKTIFDKNDLVLKFGNRLWCGYLRPAANYKSPIPLMLMKTVYIQIDTTSYESYLESSDAYFSIYVDTLEIVSVFSGDVFSIIRDDTTADLHVYFVKDFDTRYSIHLTTNEDEVTFKSSFTFDSVGVYGVIPYQELLQIHDIVITR